MSWTFVPFDPDQTMVDGNLAKLFKNEIVKSPFLFDDDPIDPAAALLVREVTQNAWDSAIEARNSDERPSPQDFKLCFDFIEARGDDKRDLIEALNLAQLSQQRQAAFGGPAERVTRGFRKDDCLDHLANAAAPLRLLKVTEHGTGGMHGPWPARGASESEQMSKLFLALCSIGDTDKRTQAGGSYGYGKSGFIRGSKIQAVIAYSCFHPNPTEPQITRRLLGAVYWPKHHLKDDNGNRWTFPGVGRFGRELKPLDNEEADDVARRLQLQVRSPHGDFSHGSTLLVVDPTVSPTHIAKAFERYWWPALVDPNLDFHIDVTDYDGQQISLEHSENEHLQPFIDAYEVAATTQDAKRADIRKWEITSPRTVADNEVGGWLSLTSARPGWTSPDEPLGHKSLVALMRYPRMVVEYLELGRRGVGPFVRGTFVASDEIDDHLKDTEPKAHDSWITEPVDGDVPDAAAQRSYYVLDRVRRAVREYKETLVIAPQEDLTGRLAHFDQLMRSLGLTGKASTNPKPPTAPRDLAINLTQRVEEASEGRKIIGTATVRHNKHNPDYNRLPDPSAIRVEIKCEFRGDDPGGDSECLSLYTRHIDPPSFEHETDNDTLIFVGLLKKGGRLRIHYHSIEYTQNWTARLRVTADVIKDGIQ